MSRDRRSGRYSTRRGRDRDSDINWTEDEAYSTEEYWLSDAGEDDWFDDDDEYLPSRSSVRGTQRGRDQWENIPDQKGEEYEGKETDEWLGSRSYDDNDFEYYRAAKQEEYSQAPGVQYYEPGRHRVSPRRFPGRLSDVRSRREEDHYIDYDEPVYQESYHSPTKNDLLDTSDIPVQWDSESDEEELYWDEGLYEEYSLGGDEAVVVEPYEESIRKGGLKALMRVFYKPHIVDNFGSFIFSMNIIATCSLFLLFIMSSNLGEEVIDGLSDLSNGAIVTLPIFHTAVIGIFMGLGLTIFLKLKNRIKRILGFGLLILLGAVLLLLPLLTFLTGFGLDKSLDQFLGMTMFLGKVMVVLIYMSPAILGTFSIWSRKAPWLLSMSGVIVLLSIVIISNIIQINEDGNINDSGVNLFVFFLYAVTLYLYIETQASSVKYYKLAEEINEPRNSDRVRYFRYALSSYFYHLIYLLVPSIIVALLIMNRAVFIGAIGSRRLAESLEVNSFLGLMVSTILLFSILALFVIVWRRRQPLIKLYRTLKVSITGMGKRRKELAETRKEIRRLKQLERTM